MTCSPGVRLTRQEISMSVDSERKLQNKVKHCSLMISAISSLATGGSAQHARQEELLIANLKSVAIRKNKSPPSPGMRGKVSNQADTLYQVNKAVYSLLRWAAGR